jgi:hypothetical protein
MLGAPGGNRRLFDRHTVDVPVTVTEIGDRGHPSDSWECRLIDISRGGIGLRSRRMSFQGRQLLVEVEQSAGIAKVLFGVVRQSRYSQGIGYAIGVEFRTLPQSPAIRNWLAQRGHFL